MPKLKPCPFCGHEPILTTKAITCGYCGALMVACKDYDDKVRLDWLVDAWNNRVNAKETVNDVFPEVFKNHKRLQP